jgi:hypothetical protein
MFYPSMVRFSTGCRATDATPLRRAHATGHFQCGNFEKVVQSKRKLRG